MFKTSSRLLLIAILACPITGVAQEPLRATSIPAAVESLSRHLGVHQIAFDLHVNGGSEAITYTFQVYEHGKLVSETQAKNSQPPSPSADAQFNVLFSDRPSNDGLLVTVTHPRGSSQEILDFKLTPPLYYPSANIEPEGKSTQFDKEGRLILAAEAAKSPDGEFHPASIDTAIRALVMQIKVLSADRQVGDR